MLLEQGDAKLHYGPFWEYQPVSMGRILVEAWDLPGNVAQHEFCPPGQPIFLGAEPGWQLDPPGKNQNARSHPCSGGCVTNPCINRRQYNCRLTDF